MGGAAHLAEGLGGLQHAADACCQLLWRWVVAGLPRCLTLLCPLHAQQAHSRCVALCGKQLSSMGFRLSKT